MERKPLRIWIGPLIAVVGLMSYFLYFVRFPFFRDSAWLNLVLVSLGLGLSVRAWCQRRAQSQSVGARILAGSALGLSTLTAALLFFYVFSMSSQLPAIQSRTQELQTVPSIGLQDQSGDTIQLAETDDRGWLISFYRGHW